MSTILLLALFLIRAILPFGMLLAFGEWIHRREANYWFRK